MKIKTRKEYNKLMKEYESLQDKFEKRDPKTGYTLPIPSNIVKRMTILMDSLLDFNYESTQSDKTKYPKDG